MKKLVTILFSISFLLTGWAQNKNWCGTSYVDSIAIAHDPSMLERRKELEKFTKTFLEQPQKSNDVLIIPVVFHVVHQYGQEHISMSVVEKCIEMINEDFAGLNSDLNDVISDFRDRVGTLNVELRLAKIDPNGNPTTGVIYYDNELTYNVDPSNYTYPLQNAIKVWDRSKYLNIWTVAGIQDNVAAWSHYPDISANIDGVVSSYNYLTKKHTISHEIGHYLNLMHPWGDSNEPGLSENCDKDDDVDDTPNTIGTYGSCNLAQSTCDTLDNVQNIMDYSSCPCMLTLGQINRMRAALNSSIGSRNNLWKPANLIATGTNDGYVDPGCKPVADISDLSQNVCPGSTISFTDFSYGGTPLSWNWEFEGGQPATSNLQNPSVTYNNTGTFKVKLTVTNDNGSSSIVRNALITVNDVLNGFAAPVTINMEDATSPFYAENESKTWYTIDAGTSHWEWFSTETNKAFRIYNFGNADETINSLITPSINMTGVVSPDTIYFDWAYSQRNSTSLDALKVFVSSDCGTTWALRVAKSGKSLSTTGAYTPGEFIPSSAQWKTGKIDITAYKNKTHLEIKFQVESNKGNYLYVDNLKIEGTPIVGIPENNNIQAINIYPNPAKEFTVSYFVKEPQIVNLKITNSIGKLIHSQSEIAEPGVNNVKISSGELNIPVGIYFITVVTQEYTSSKKVVVY